jgi:hypothetical protein
VLTGGSNPFMVQAGPCAGCGTTGYLLSTGGPGICPACDCVPAERRVRQLAEENRMLRQRVAELEGPGLPTEVI